MSAEFALEIVHPEVPFEQGQILGSAGAPIPPEIIANFRAFHEQRKPGSLEPELSRVFKYTGQEIPRTPEQERANAVGLINGYESGLGFFLLSPLSDGTTRLDIHEMATLPPGLVSASPESLDAYMTGHGLQKPMHLKDGRVYRGNVSVADAHALGFIVRAATLDVRLHPGDIPTSELEWMAFEAGSNPDEAARSRAFSEALSEAIEQRVDLGVVQGMYTLGQRMAAKLSA